MVMFSSTEGGGGGEGRGVGNTEGARHRLTETFMCRKLKALMNLYILCKIFSFQIRVPVESCHWAPGPPYFGKKGTKSHKEEKPASKTHPPCFLLFSFIFFCFVLFSCFFSNQWICKPEKYYLNSIFPRKR